MLVVRRLIVGKRGGSPEKGALTSSMQLSVNGRAVEEMEEGIPDLDYTPQSPSQYHFISNTCSPEHKMLPLRNRTAQAGGEVPG